MVDRVRSRFWSAVRDRPAGCIARDQRGAALVEFAIIFPVLIVLVFGCIDFGRAFFLRNNLVAAVREGARFGAVLGTSPTPCASTAAIRARVRTYVTSFGGLALTDDQIPVTFPGACGTGAVTDVRVQIADYPFTPLTPVFRLVGASTTIRLSNISAQYRWEQSATPP